MHSISMILLHTKVKNNEGKEAHKFVSYLSKNKLNSTQLNLLFMKSYISGYHHALVMVILNMSLSTNAPTLSSSLGGERRFCMTSRTRFTMPFFSHKWQIPVTNLLITNQKQGFYELITTTVICDWWQVLWNWSQNVVTYLLTFNSILMEPTAKIE